MSPIYRPIPTRIHAEIVAISDANATSAVIADLVRIFSSVDLMFSFIDNINIIDVAHTDIGANGNGISAPMKLMLLISSIMSNLDCVYDSSLT